MTCITPITWHVRHQTWRGRVLMTADRFESHKFYVPLTCQLFVLRSSLAESPGLHTCQSLIPQILGQNTLLNLQTLGQTAMSCETIANVGCAISRLWACLGCPKNDNCSWKTPRILRRYFGGWKNVNKEFERFSKRKFSIVFPQKYRTRFLCVFRARLSCSWHPNTPRFSKQWIGHYRHYRPFHFSRVWEQNCVFWRVPAHCHAKQVVTLQWQLLTQLRWLVTRLHRATRYCGGSTE